MTEEWNGVIFGMGVLILGTVILVVVLILAGSFAKAKVARREEEKLEAILHRYEDLASHVRDHQSAIATDTADVRRRVIEVERILRAVD